MLNDRDKLLGKIIEMASIAIEVLGTVSNEADDDGDRRWSDEDSWEVAVGDSCIDVTINRCNRGHIQRWYVPDIESAAEFNQELSEFIKETKL